MSKPTLNLKILLAVAIGGLVLFATLSVTALHTVKFQNYARQEASQQLNRVASTIRSETERLLEPALAIAQHFAEAAMGNQNTHSGDDRSTQFSRFLNAVEIIPFQNRHISSAYVGHRDGSFVILTKNTAALRKAVSLPQAYRSAYLRFERDATVPDIVDRWSHRVDGGWQSIDLPKSSYEPRTRPWYKLAQERAGQVWTNLYRFYGQHGFGITLVRGVRDKRGTLNAVLGVDIRLESLTEFIRSASISPNGFAFVATQDGTLIAHPGLNAALLPDQMEKISPHVSDMRTVRGRDAEILQALKSADTSVVTLNVEGNPYLAHRTSLALSLGMDASLYIAAPLSDFTAVASDATRTSLALAGLVTMLMLGFGTWIARAIARPVREAAATMSAVSQLELRKNGAASRSALTEIDLLNHASNRMSSALSGFVRYVPSEVVRELLEHDEPIELGGSRRDITVLFTDIKDFTALAETEQPELLVSSLADYFDIIAEVVSATGGTIDKFMGDGVMAFWGAPRACTNHSQRACDAVLEIAKRIDGLNEMRDAANLPLLTTRFGLHRGDAFVGNVGARNRFGYTALGDVVNTAARLEYANKDLGTQILVSDAVVAAASEVHQFVARDTIKLRGKSTLMDVYELSRSDASGTGPSLALAS